MSLVQQLQNEHRAIQKGLEEAFSQVNEPSKAQATLGKVRNILLQHLAREDAELYPALDALAQGNAEMQAVLSEYRTEMKTVSKAALEFFEAVDSGTVEGFRFAREFGGLNSVLANRIRREESKLYPLLTGLS